jgi:tRNA 2-thiouridine synthesizing protein A
MIVHFLDITRYYCPMTFVKVKVKLCEMVPGDVLDVLLTGEEPLRNIPAAVVRDGYNVLDVHPVAEDVYRVRIRK